MRHIAASERRIPFRGFLLLPNAEKVNLPDRVILHDEFRLHYASAVANHCSVPFHSVDGKVLLKGAADKKENFYPIAILW